MELLVVILLGVLAVAMLARTWWSARAGRDPTSSVSSFHRALAAMEPERDSDSPRAAQQVTRPSHQPDEAADDDASGREQPER